ncbi:MAG: cell division protein ZapE, partial [Pseudomonadota bacterium]
AKAMDAAFTRLTGGAAPHAETLIVKGRELVAPRAAHGAARFEFRDLVDAALGPGDYLAIAKRYHTVFLDGVEKMTPARRDVAKRFVTLIDALYERKAKLICSAEAAPVDLYPAGDGAFEFQRTASRLTEMQSAEYLAKGVGEVAA